MKINSKVKGDAPTNNHNETLRGVAVSSQVKAGAQDFHRRPGRPR